MSSKTRPPPLISGLVCSLNKRNVLIWVCEILLLAVSGLVLFHNIKATRFNCFNNYDLGIPHQAMVELATSGSLNPYQSVRGTHVFNDHFDPIQFVPGLFLGLFNYSINATLIWEWLCFMAFILMVWTLKPQASWSERLLVATVYFFSKGIAVPLTYPAHPSFWSLPVFAALGYGLYRGNIKWIALSAVSLCLFKENYPFGLITLGFYFLLIKPYRRLGGFLFLTGIGWSFFVVWLRPLLIGPTTGFGEAMAKGFFSAPISTLIGATARFSVVSFLSIFTPLLLLIATTTSAASLQSFFKSVVQRKYHETWACIFFLFPLFLIQFLANNFYFQYSFPFFAVSLSVLFFKGAFLQLSRKPVIATLVGLAFFLSSAQVYSKVVKLVLFDKSGGCIISQAKNASTKTLREQVEQLPSNARVGATGGVIPQLIRPHLTIFHLFAEPYDPGHYTHLVIERNRSGDTYPASPERLEEVIQRCAPYFEEILQDDTYYFLARGTIPHSCFGNLVRK